MKKTYPTAVVDLFEKQAGPVHNSLGQVDPGQTNRYSWKYSYKYKYKYTYRCKNSILEQTGFVDKVLGEADVAILRPVSHVGKYPEGIYERSLGRSHTRIPRKTVSRSLWIF